MAQLSISRNITELARREPDRPAVRDSVRALSRRQLDEQTNALARTYAALGVRAGDLVTIALPNGVGFVQACLATWKLGATPQPVSAKLPPPELAAILELAAPRLVVTHELAPTPTPPCCRMPSAPSGRRRRPAVRPAGPS